MPDSGILKAMSGRFLLSLVTVWKTGFSYLLPLGQTRNSTINVDPPTWTLRAVRTDMGVLERKLRAGTPSKGLVCLLSFPVFYSNIYWTATCVYCIRQHGEHKTNVRTIPTARKVLTVGKTRHIWKLNNKTVCKNEKKWRDFWSMERGGPVPFKEERGGRGNKMMKGLQRDASEAEDREAAATWAETQRPESSRHVPGSLKEPEGPEWELGTGDDTGKEGLGQFVKNCEFPATELDLTYWQRDII